MRCLPLTSSQHCYCRPHVDQATAPPFPCLPPPRPFLPRTPPPCFPAHLARKQQCHRHRGAGTSVWCHCHCCDAGVPADRVLISSVGQLEVLGSKPLQGNSRRIFPLQLGGTGSLLLPPALLYLCRRPKSRQILSMASVGCGCGCLCSLLTSAG
jgi:hypothetical protein